MAFGCDDARGRMAGAVRVAPHGDERHGGARRGGAFTEVSAARARPRGDLVAALVGVVLAGASPLAGCHASPDDPAGQARELTDSTRRPNALRNIEQLFTVALAAANGDRTDPKVRVVIDATVAPMTDAYLAFPDDLPSGGKILTLLDEMRDPCALPAALKALDWRPVTQDHALTAAKFVRQIDVPPEKLAAVADALGAAASKVRQSRPADVRLRRELIFALGSLRDPRALPPLVAIMERQAEDQDFRFNRLAASEVAKLVTGPEHVPMLLKALFRFDAAQPQLELQDFARSGLVRIGSPSVDPLLAVYRGQDPEVLAIAKEYEGVLRARGVEGFTALTIMATRAAASLGEIGDLRAYGPLLTTAQDAKVDGNVRWEAALTLVKFPVPDNQRVQMRQTLIDLYNASPPDRKYRLLAAIQERTFDDGFLSFFEAQARADTLVDLRILAFVSHAKLANKREAQALRAVLATEPSVEDGGYRHQFEEFVPMLALAEACDEDVTCWMKKFKDSSDATSVIKAATMLGRLGSRREGVVAALVEKLNFPKIDVRIAVLYALDRVATEGSVAAVAVLDELEAKEEGTQLGKQFSAYALPIRARLASRGG